MAISSAQQDKTYEEIEEVLAKKPKSENNCLTSKDLMKLEYMERMIKELLRIFPPGAVFARQISEDI